MKLKYLFTAHFKDGFQYKQTQEDTSIFEPEKRSAYYDVDSGLLAKEHGQLTSFALTDQTNGNKYVIDLDFVSKGHPERVKIIYWRHNERDFQIVNENDQPVFTSEPRTIFTEFGYEYTNEEGKVEREVLNLE